MGNCFSETSVEKAIKKATKLKNDRLKASFDLVELYTSLSLLQEGEKNAAISELTLSELEKDITLNFKGEITVYLRSGDETLSTTLKMEVYNDIVVKVKKYIQYKKDREEVVQFASSVETEGIKGI